MRSIQIGLLTLAILTSGALLDTPGVSASIDMIAVEMAKTQYWKYIYQAINGFKVDNYNFDKDKGHVNSNTFNIKTAPHSMDITPYSSTEVEITIQKMDAYFKSEDFQFNLWFMPVKGTLTVEMTDIEISTVLELSSSTVNKRNLMAFKGKSTSATVNTDNLKFDISGGMLAKIADSFVPIFKKYIKNQIENQIETKLTSDLPKILNTLVQQDNGFANMTGGILNGLTFDYAIESNGQVNDHYISLGLNGTVFNSGKYFVPDTNQISLPSHNSSVSSQFQILLSNYFFDSLAHAYFQGKSYNFTVTSQDVPSTFMINLTTTGLNSFFSGLTDIFGKDIPVDLGFRVIQAYDFDSSYGKQMASISGELDLTMWINYQNGTIIQLATFEFPDLKIDFEIFLNGYKAYSNIEKMTVQNIFMASQFTESKMDLAIFKTFFNACFGYSVAYFNEHLKTQFIQIPQIFMQTFYLTDLNLYYYDDYMLLGATPTFLPKSLNSEEYVTVQEFLQ